MKISSATSAAFLGLLHSSDDSSFFSVADAATTATASTSSSSGAMHPTLEKFSSQFRCPYAKEWLTKGAHRAAIDLGLTSSGGDHHSPHRHQRRRKLEDAAAGEIMGSCSYNNPWSGESCMEFRGSGWMEDAMKERCDAEAESELSTGGSSSCGGEDSSTTMAGYCLKSVNDNDDTMIEATAMMISEMADCDGNKMACETFVGGSFVASSECGGDGDAPTKNDGHDYSNMAGPSSNGDSNNCLIAPGAIGAAHQAASSEGYSATCPGTPAEGSPYMWPLNWSADLDTQSMAFGSDEVVYRSRSRVFYRLDKNWKRADTTLAKGKLRTVGQGPCPADQIDEEFEGIKSCTKDDDYESGRSPLTTMIHRGGKMYFITWKDGAAVGERDPALIDECNYMDLMVIGNIRPDWFLDDRGSDTDVQYLGDQHAYYAAYERPRLLKQWRKKDFANQYFVMSMQGNPPANRSDPEASLEDTMHWPLILNVPGEGFGDDFLQVYDNHTLLSDEDDDLFELVENLLDINGTCPLIGSGGEVGPPTNEVHIPSNLEVDPNSWYSNVYTFSPVWQPPMNLVTDDSSDGNMATTEKERVKVQSCYDSESKSVQLNVEFMDIEAIEMGATSELPWMSLGYRISDVCSMIQPDGTDSDIIMVTSQAASDGAPSAYSGKLSSAAKTLQPAGLTAISESLVPLEEVAGYSDVSVTAPMLDDGSVAVERSVSLSNPSSVTLSFKQEFPEGPPEIMHLMYAIGMSAEFGIHVSRSCFDVTEFPTCSSQIASSSSSDPPPPRTNEAIDAWKEENAASSSSQIKPLLLTLCMTILSVTLLNHI